VIANYFDKKTRTSKSYTKNCKTYLKCNCSVVQNLDHINDQFCQVEIDMGMYRAARIMNMTMIRIIRDISKCL